MFRSQMQRCLSVLGRVCAFSGHAGRLVTAEGRAAAGIGLSLTTDLVNLPDRPCCSICSGGVFVTDTSPAAIPHAQKENANCEKKGENRV